MIATSRRFLTAKQVAEQLEIALNTVYALRVRGDLPAEPRGNRSWRWTQEAVDAYRQSQTPAKAVPHDLTELIDQRIRAFFQERIGA